MSNSVVEKIYTPPLIFSHNILFNKENCRKKWSGLGEKGGQDKAHTHRKHTMLYVYIMASLLCIWWASLTALCKRPLAASSSPVIMLYCEGHKVKLQLWFKKKVYLYTFYIIWIYKRLFCQDICCPFTVYSFNSFGSDKEVCCFSV